MTQTTNEIRETFLQYFEGRDHQRLASSNLVTKDDPTLLFTNAGMVQFKERFTSSEKETNPRATTAQKCLRAGGKHNDLDQVGYTSRHHTFFEMLGNFSFGDYFKEHAIELSWDLVTQGYGLDPEKLCITIHDSDNEARALWKKIANLPDHKIISISGSDNYWSMGNTGPCGPCSEIFFDHGEHIPGGPPGSKDQDLDRFVEIWNLVFMQEYQHEDGRKTPLEKQSIDTGMGLERISAVLQGTHDNYEIDIFQNLIQEISDLSEKPPSTHHRVIADHLRSSCFLIAEGLMPSNEGQAYVLRRILRRAIRHCHSLDSKGLMPRLVHTLAQQMGSAFPELQENQDKIAKTIHEEEQKFGNALAKGLRKLQKDISKLGESEPLPGKTAFQLFETFGIPVDLTQDVLREQGRTVEIQGFDQALKEHSEKSRRAREKSRNS